MTFSFFIRTAVIAAIFTSHHYTKPSHFIKKMGFSTGLAVGSTAGITVGSSATYYIHTGKNKTDSENTKKPKNPVPLAEATIPFQANITGLNGKTGDIEIDAHLGTLNNISLHPENLSLGDATSLARKLKEKKPEETSAHAETDKPAIHLEGQLSLMIQRSPNGSISIGIDNRRPLITLIEVDPHLTGQIIQEALPGLARRQLSSIITDHTPF